MKIIKKQKGQALVEFAIILPILLLFVMGIAQFGMMLNAYLTIQNSAREGARLGIVGGSNVEISNLIISISPSLTPENLTVNVTPDEVNRSSGETLTLTVIYNYHLTVPIISTMLGNVVELKAQTTMRIEWVVNEMKKFNKKGNVSIILCLIMGSLLGFTAYVVDIGLVYIEKTRLTDAIDSAVLAGSLELPQNPTNAREVALEFLEKNNVDSSSTIIVISDDNKSIEIAGVRNVKHIFAPIIGIDSSKVSFSSKAQIGPIKIVNGGIRPFAVVSYNFSYGQLVTLKEGAGDCYNGNYGAVALGGNGANNFRANALYGYNGTLSVGDYVSTEPGNMAGAANSIKNYINSEQSTFSTFTRESIRLWTIPIVDSLEVNGRKEVLITGFAEFFVEDVVGKSGKIEISGRFVKFVTKGEIDMTLKDTGLYGVKLVK